MGGASCQGRKINAGVNIAVTESSHAIGKTRADWENAMPWNFHVTRRYVPGEAGAEIPLEEWVRLVERDSELVLIPSAYAPSRIAPLSAAQWYGHPEAGVPVVFEWLAGNLTVARPDAPTLDKLRALAAALGGHVEDDDGGWYDRHGHFLGHLAVV